ncbi:hypothetical protein [Phenylobacterium sp.]|uniref:hypothetical protein n=1 Tax=Phenylobacterium sp. TaxID=1871053 RepID=UPI002FCBF272
MIFIAPVPTNAGPFGEILENLRSAVMELQQPTQPGRVFACASADLPSAADWTGAVLRDTTINILAVSDGTSWIRQDTGAAI